MDRFVWKHQYFEKNCIKLTFSGCPINFTKVMYIAPSSGDILLNLNLLFKVMLRRFVVVFWCLEWEIWECCNFERLMEIHSNPLILYSQTGFKIISFSLKAQANKGSSTVFRSSLHYVKQCLLSRPGLKVHFSYTQHVAFYVRKHVYTLSSHINQCYQSIACFPPCKCWLSVFRECIRV